MSGVQQAVFQNQRSFGPAPGQDAYTTPGNYTWVAPTAVTSISVVAIGGAAAGCRGGSLGYKNNISTTPGTGYAVVVGNANATSRFVCTVKGSGGAVSCAPFFVGDGGGLGGISAGLGGGGAGGYAGNGGSVTGGSGGNGAAISRCCCGSFGQAGGGGVGILGQGASGANGIPVGACRPGKGGSGGADGSGITGNIVGGNGGAFGGASGGGNAGSGTPATGAVRIIWPGNTRSFPSTGTGDQ